ncbi:MAG TPA: arginine--tRNA ligase [Herpetosiphonaceae bacterium]|nr:arginine--tRNA ligase [Herpetosiphonaceae bacterium]
MQYALDRFEHDARMAIETTGLVPADVIDLAEPKANVPADLSFPCFRAAKAQGLNPAELARTLAGAIPALEGTLVGGVVATGPFLNFQVNPEILISTVLAEVEKLADRYGRDDVGAGKTVIVEYSSPNIARKMHVGHLRTTIIGHAIDNILTALGYETISDNHLGDWGTQFGGLLYAYDTWGFKPELEHDPIEAMIDLYQRFNAEARENPELLDEARKWFKRLEEGNPEARRLWRWMIDLTMSEFERTYQRLGVTFDHAYGESFYEPMLAGVVDEAITKGVARIEEGGAVSVSFDNKLPSYLIRTSDGRTLYQTRDIAAAIFRFREWKPDRNIYVVGHEQTLHFQQVFETLRRMGYEEIADRSLHIAFGQLNNPEGQRFSMRRGTTIYLEDVLEEAVLRAREIVDEKNPDLPEQERAVIAEAVGIGAVIYNDLYQDPKRNITFDWDRMLAFTGNSAPYIQMMHARCCSILREAGLREAPEPPGTLLPLWDRLPAANVHLLSADQELGLVKAIARFPQHIRRGGANFTPYTVAEWLYETARAFSRFYDDLSVINAGSPKLRDARLRLVAATAQSLRNGLRLLGIHAPERM